MLFDVLSTSGFPVGVAWKRHMTASNAIVNNNYNYIYIYDNYDSNTTYIYIHIWGGLETTYDNK